MHGSDTPARHKVTQRTQLLRLRDFLECNDLCAGFTDDRRNGLKILVSALANRTRSQNIRYSRSSVQSWVRSEPHVALGVRILRAERNPPKCQAPMPNTRNKAARNSLIFMELDTHQGDFYKLIDKSN